jgi:hypothetical protein
MGRHDACEEGARPERASRVATEAAQAGALAPVDAASRNAVRERAFLYDIHLATFAGLLIQHGP